METGGYGIFLSWNNQEEGFRIPVNPESLEVKEAGQGKTYNIVGPGGSTDETRAGEINVILSPKLKEIQFSSIFPAVEYPFVHDKATLFPPMKYVNDIRRWMETKHPIRFIFVKQYAELKTVVDNDIKKDIVIPASIESFEWKEVAGSPGDIEYSLSLKEYVFYSARKAVVRRNELGEETVVQLPPDRPDERVRPEMYALRPGEGLWHVARLLLNDESRYREIQELNGISDVQLRRLPVGMVLRIPQN